MFSRSCHTRDSMTWTHNLSITLSKSNVLADQTILLHLPDEHNICTDSLPRTFHVYVLWEAMERMQ